MKLFVILPALIVGGVVQATPMSLATGSGTAVLTKTAFSTSQEDVLNAIHAATSPVPATSLEKRQVNPTLVFCSDENCSEDCEAFDIIGVPLDTCFAAQPNPFYSLFINNPSNEELLFAVGAAANTVCSGLSFLPETNTCYGISPYGETWELAK